MDHFRQNTQVTHYIWVHPNDTALSSDVVYLNIYEAPRLGIVHAHMSALSQGTDLIT